MRLSRVWQALVYVRLPLCGPRTMPKRPRGRLGLADRFCEAIEELTAERQTRPCAAPWIRVHGVARIAGSATMSANDPIFRGVAAAG
jgi:hypothetical protein